MRSATARESTRHAALFCVGAGQWDQTIYHHTHPPPLKANLVQVTLVTWVPSAATPPVPYTSPPSRPLVLPPRAPEERTTPTADRTARSALASDSPVAARTASAAAALRTETLRLRSAAAPPAASAAARPAWASQRASRNRSGSATHPRRPHPLAGLARLALPTARLPPARRRPPAVRLGHRPTPVRGGTGRRFPALVVAHAHTACRGRDRQRSSDRDSQTAGCGQLAHGRHLQGTGRGFHCPTPCAPHGTRPRAPQGTRPCTPPTPRARAPVPRPGTPIRAPPAATRPHSPLPGTSTRARPAAASRTKTSSTS